MGSHVCDEVGYFLVLWCGNCLFVLYCFLLVLWVVGHCVDLLLVVVGYCIGLLLVVVRWHCMYLLLVVVRCHCVDLLLVVVWCHCVDLLLVVVFWWWCSALACIVEVFPTPCVAAFYCFAMFFEMSIWSI